MRNFCFKKLTQLFVAVAFAFFCYQPLVAEKDAEDLEEALMMKLLEKRAKKRTKGDDEESPRFSKADLKYLKSDDKSEISVSVINDIKGILKEPCLNLLASSELISWSELNERVDKAKKSLEMFSVKYKSELASGGKATSSTLAAPTGMPMPGKTMAVMPGVKPAGMPGAIAKAKAAEDDDEEEDDEDEKPKSRAGGMPGVKPLGVGMPGLKPAASGMPGLKPAAPSGMPGLGGGMPGLTTVPAGGMPGVGGGMPMAR